MSIFDIFKKEEVLSTGGVSPTVLVILDGWGIAPDSPGNAIAKAKKPNFDYLMSTFPHGELEASGEAVGLPANEVGNTEVGHLNMGAGRLMLQDLKRIDKAISTGTFFENRALVAAIDWTKKNSSKLHIMGLIGSGHVHSSVDHLFGLIDLCKRSGVANVCFHLFTDGRDSQPTEGKEIIAKIEERIKSAGVGSIATISGRYYAMDRDKRWDRTRLAYEAIVVGRGNLAASAVEALQNSYASKLTDEFVVPTIINKNGMVSDNDAVIFFNFRIDRPRQLTMAFNIPDFENLKSFEFGKDPEKGGRSEGAVEFGATFARAKIAKNLFFVTMTEYDKKIPVSGVSYPPEVVKNSLAEVVFASHLKQLRLSESEKDRFVSYYFDGLHEGKFEGEDAVVIPSPKVTTYDKKPAMSIVELCQEFKNQVSKGIYNFIVLNIANPDMVAHTGNLKAAITAVEAADKALGEITEAVMAHRGTMLVTADHGNAEELITYPSSAFFFTTESGEVNTDHSNSSVPVIVANGSLKGKVQVLPKGSLADVAPTILRLMNLSIPPEMTGKNLLEVKANG
ncbi:MAG: 2,3-bisphosphoglycerate-independent phosphoglycerate mutase [Patescibacteria group bacterium]